MTADHGRMHPQLAATLAGLRARRGFDAARCVAAKVTLLRRYFSKARLTSAVVGVSGGVDSAVVLGLLMRAAGGDSPISRVVGVLAPYREIPQGVSNQDTATERGREVVRTFGAECFEIDLSAAHATVKTSVERGVGVAGDAWADGQLVSNLRTPALYQVVTLLAQAGHPGVLVGTTTRDEGSFIGYFGKASDGLCDLQAISDLHKREVYALARTLGVPDSVIAAAPTGDIWDGRDDRALIGAPFDAVELYTQLRCLADDERAAAIGEWGEAARAEFAGWQGCIERLHRENAHKYLGGSPAVHLDVYARAVPGGWRVDAEPGRAGNAVVNEVTIAAEVTGARDVEREEIGRGESVVLLHGVLGPEECERLLAELRGHAWVPVGIDGRRAGFDPAVQAIGSWRLSSFHERLARTLWSRIAAHVPAVRILDEDSPTDHDGHPVWRASGVNPLLRFIRYAPGGGLVPHYDSTYIRDERERTLMSMVVSLTDGGATRLIAERPGDRGEYADWPRFAAAAEVELAIRPRAGSAVLFDHRVLHDSAPVTAEKVVIRTDIFYVRCGPPEGRVFPARMLGMPGGTR